MFCQNCGSPMKDGDRFCPNCGALNSPDTGGGPARETVSPWEQPTGGKKKKKTGLVLGLGAAAVAAVAVISAAAVMVGGLFASPKQQVEKALLKSVSAWQAAGEKVDRPDMKQWRKDQSLHQEGSLELRDISALVGGDLSTLKGLGLRMGSDYDGEERKMSMELGAYWGGEDIVSLQIVGDDSKLWAASPEFTGDAFYGVDTKTMGADLKKITGRDPLDGLSFNLFDIVDLTVEWTDTEAVEQGLKDAAAKLWEAAEVEKTGEKTLDLNGTSAKTTGYRVTIPEKALERFVDDLEDVVSDLDYPGYCEKLFRSIGMPEDILEDAMDDLNSADVYGELFDGMRDGIDGDLELDAYLSGGYLSAVRYENRVNRTDVELAVYLGGGKEYVDNFSVTLDSSNKDFDVSIEIQSSGDHGMKNGAYTDETVFRVRWDGGGSFRITSEVSFDPESKSDNFQWGLSADVSGQKVTLDAEGDLEMDKEHLSMDLNSVSLRAMNMKICTLAVRYAVSPNPDPISAGNAKMIFDLSELELMQIGNEIMNNAERWRSNMEARLPSDLYRYLSRMFY